MTRLLEWLRLLGNEGAVANAKLLHDARLREDWQIHAVERHVVASGPVARRTA